MRNATVSLFLCMAIVLIPGWLFAQQETHHPETPAPAAAPAETESESDIFENEQETKESTAGEATGDGMMARHREMAAKMKEMNARLEQKIQSMNQASGDQKLQAMADVVNTMFSQRKEMMEKTMDMHGRMCKTMAGKMDHGSMSMDHGSMPTKDGRRAMKMKKGAGDAEKSMIIIIQE